MTDNLVKIQRGNLSTIALDYFGQELKDQQKMLLSRMMIDYRSEKLDTNKLIGFVASYTALEDLWSSLQRQVTNANRIQKEEIENVSRNPES